MEETTYSDSQDRKLANFIVGYYVVQALNLYVKLVIVNFSSWTFLSRGSLIVLLFFALPPMINRKIKDFFATEIIFIILFAYTFVFQYATLDEYSSIVMNVFTVFIPMGIAIASINDKSILLQRMYLMAWPTQIVLIVVLLSMTGYGYTMIGGYTLVFQMLVIFDHFCEKGKWYDLLACAIDIVLIILYGSRGPVLCMATMILLKTLFSFNVSKVKKVGIIIVIGVLVLFYNQIINMFIAIADYMDYSSRTLSLLLDNSITSDSGRSDLVLYYLEMIRKGPVLGYGLVGGWSSSGMYPHNIFLELLLAFGSLIGVLLCVLVVIICWLGVVSKEENTRRISNILFAYSVSLLVSDSFLKCPMFFMLFAIGLQSCPIRIVFGTTT